MSGNRRTTLKRAIANLCFPLVTVGFIAAVYATAAAIVGESLILPRLGEILAEAGKLLTKSSFYKSLLFTLLRALAAFAAAFVAGGALGIAANASGAVEKLLSPLMVLLRAIPTMAVIFLLVLWFRSAYAPMIVAFTILLPLCYAETKTALSSLDGGIFEMCKVYAVPKRRVLARFVLPQIAPHTGPATIIATIPHRTPTIITQPSSTLSIVATSTGPGVGGMNAWPTASPASSGIA